jgi:cytidine deaminase
VLAELGAPTTEVFLAPAAGGAVSHTLGELLPRAFKF